MLTGTGLGVAIAAILFGAVGLGAALHWLWVRTGRVRPRDRARVAELMDDLHQIEAKREAAEEALREAGERHAQREEQLGLELAEARADLETMHGGLVNARERLMALEAELEQFRGAGAAPGGSGRDAPQED